MDKIAQAVLETLIYSDLFGCPLKLDNLHKFLISKPPVSVPDLDSNLKLLMETGRIELSNGFYCLSGMSRMTQGREKIEEISRRKIKSLNTWLKTLAILPSVKMVGITGALSYYGGSPLDDVDLIIVTSKNRMWLTRLLVFLSLKILGRKRGDGQLRTDNKICINVWCDEDNLNVPLQEQDLVIAQDVAHLIPVVNKSGMYQKFIQSNLWIKTFLPNWNF